MKTPDIPTVVKVTPEEAKEIRINASRLRNLCKDAVYSAADLAHNNPSISPTDIGDQVWKQLELEEVFAWLGHQGYRLLIQAGWNPYRPPTDDDSTPNSAGGELSD